MGAQGFEREAEGKQIENERDEFLVDVRERHPMLAVTGEDEHQQSGDEGERPFGPAHLCLRHWRRQGRFALMEDLREGPPCRNADEKADDERENLPRERMQGNDAGGEIKDGTQKWAERHERRNKLGGTEKFCDPCEGPVVPVESGEREEQSVGYEGYDSDQKRLARFGGTK